MTYRMNREDTEALVLWYNKNKRSLPWRDTGNPYHVWISEIMLQQTRIEAVIEHYLRFMEELPSVEALASVEDDRLMKLWEGLGYYSRARNLKKCALRLQQDYSGCLPADYKLLCSLPGIGPYTAGAISSICFGLPEPAVDGNVLRVLARYFGIDDDIRSTAVHASVTAAVQTALAEQIDRNDVSSFNQGIMELGETLCIPNGTPDCTHCPLASHCSACLNGRTREIPYRSPLKNRRIVNRTLLILRDGERFLLRKRPDHGLLAGMYEFIGTDGHLSLSEVRSYAESMGIFPLRVTPLPASKHIFSHLEWHMKAYEVQCAQIDSQQSSDTILLSKKELADKAVPSAFRTYTDYYALKE